MLNRLCELQLEGPELLVCLPLIEATPGATSSGEKAIIIDDIALRGFSSKELSGRHQDESV